MLDNRKNNIKQWLRLFLVIFCAFFVGIFAMMIMEGYTFTIDRKFISGTYRIRQEWLTTIVKIFTNLCSVAAIASIVLFIIIFVKDWTYKIFAMFNIGIAAVVNIIVKHIVKRARPFVETLIMERGYSFPSGHAMMAIAIFGFLAYIIYGSIKYRPIKLMMSGICVLIGMLVAISRVYLGVHYFTDVLCGAMLGLAVLTISIMGHKYLITLLEKKKRRKKSLG